MAACARGDPVSGRRRRTRRRGIRPRAAPRPATPIPPSGPIPWLPPAGTIHYSGLSARVEHRFTKSLYLLNSFTWGKGMGDSEQALEDFAGYYPANPQNIHALAAEKGLSRS